MPVLARNPIRAVVDLNGRLPQRRGVLDKGRTVEVPLRSDAGTNLVRHSHAEPRVAPSNWRN